MTLPTNVGSAPRIQGTTPNTGTQGSGPTGRLGQFKLAVGNFFAKLLPSHGSGTPSNSTTLHARSLGVAQPGLPLTTLDNPEMGQTSDLGKDQNYHENPDPYKAHGTEYQGLPPSLRDDSPASEYGRAPLNELKQAESPYGKAPLNKLEQPVSEYANRPPEVDPKPVNQYANSPFGPTSPYGRAPLNVRDTPPPDESKQ